MKWIMILILLVPVGYMIYRVVANINPNPQYEYGQKVDSLNGVYVYYNGNIAHVDGRNLAPDGYNLGLKYQCVEFVKRYYYEYYHHEMPDAYGHAKDFFDKTIKDGKINSQRNLIQYVNGSVSKPCVGDLLIFNGHAANPYGHVAVVSLVSSEQIELIQQNPGPFSPSRIVLKLSFKNGLYWIEHEGLLGWLRVKKL